MGEEGYREGNSKSVAEKRFNEVIEVFCVWVNLFLSFNGYFVGNFTAAVATEFFFYSTIVLVVLVPLGIKLLQPQPQPSAESNFWLPPPSSWAYRFQPRIQLSCSAATALLAYNFTGLIEMLTYLFQIYFCL